MKEITGGNNYSYHLGAMFAPNPSSLWSTKSQRLIAKGSWNAMGVWMGSSESNWGHKPVMELDVYNSTQNRGHVFRVNKGYWPNRLPGTTRCKGLVRSRRVSSCFQRHMVGLDSRPMPGVPLRDVEKFSYFGWDDKSVYDNVPEYRGRLYNKPPYRSPIQPTYDEIVSHNLGRINKWLDVGWTPGGEVLLARVLSQIRTKRWKGPKHTREVKGLHRYYDKLG